MELEHVIPSAYSLGSLFPHIAAACLLFSSSANALDKSGVSPTKISLPSGPGSIDGLGESFEAQLNTGTFTYSVPIELPKVRGAASSSLALAYNSGNGNGPCGMGWKLEVPRLQRQTDKGLPQYLPTDTIIDSTGEELVKLADGAYRSENEGKSVRFERQADDSWIARMPNGSVMVLGGSANARLAGPSGTFAWQISSLTDTNGNRTSYTYLQDGGQIYLASVTVGEHVSLPSETFTAVFGYESGRTDPILDFRPGFSSQTKLRLASVSISHGARRIAHYRFAYHPTVPVSLLASITLFGDERSSLGVGAQPNVDFLPPHQFEYSLPTFAQNWQMVTVAGAPGFSIANNQMEFTDVNHDALPDLVIDDQGTYYTALNRGAGKDWGAMQLLQNAPNARLNVDGTQLADLRGDGNSRLLVKDDTTFNFRSFETATRLSLPTNFVIPGAFQFTSPEVRFIDINNDKAMDLMLSDGDGHFDYLINRQASGQANYVLPNPPPAPDLISFQANWQLADINGDRLVDIIRPATREQGGCAFHYSQGWGKFSARQIMLNAPREAELGPRGLAAITALDVNQDGWTDCVCVESGIVRIWLNQGGAAFAPPVTISGPQIPEYQEGITAIRFADMNGNGSTDIVWNRTDGTAAQRLQYLELSPGTKPYLLTKATNELGGSVSAEYRSSVAYMVEADGTPQQWTTLSPISIPVVSALVENDGRSHDYRSEITYRNAYYDGVEKEFRGFEFATRKEIGNATEGAPTLSTDMVFYTGNPQATPPEHESFKGKPRSIEQRDEATGAVFSRVTHRWLHRQLALALDVAETRKITLAYEDFEETTLLEKGPVAEAVTLQREFNVDDYGNTTRSADYGRVEGANRSAWDDERITISTYSAAYPSGLNAWLLDLPVQSETQDENGFVITRSQSFYDDSGFNGANLGQVSKGNLTLVRRWYDIAGNKFIPTSRSEFDGYGNVTGVYDPLGTPGNLTPGHYRSFVYDTHIHTFPETENVRTGNPDCPLLSATATYDYGLGVLQSFTDFNSQTTSLIFDTFGRLTSMIRPGDTMASPTVSYSYLLSQNHATGILNYIETKRRETAGDGTIDSRDYFDGLGRKIQSRIESEVSGQVVVSDATEFNQRRMAWKTYLPCFAAGDLNFSSIPPSTAYREAQYDATGRTLRTYQPLAPGATSRAYAETVYEPSSLLIKDEEQTSPTSSHFGAANRQIFDGLKSGDGKSRLREVQEIVKLSDTGDVIGTAATWRTQYRFDLLDNLVGITDSQNNVKSLTFDAMSRMTGMDDPDSGLLSLIYDDASNLKQSTDSNNHVIQYGYDGANRPTSEDYLDAANLTPDVRYFYDVPTANLTLGDGSFGSGANTKGRLAYVQDLSGEEHLSYDARGRTEWEVKRLPDAELGLLVSYRTQYSFDSADRLQRVIYPDSDFVDYQYNARSLLSSISGGPSGFLISSLSYRASGQEDTVSYGNGVTTVRDYDHRLRLSTLKTRSPGNVRSYLDFEYALDAASNITQIDDHRALIGQTDAAARQNTQSFVYDDLYRITQAAWPSAKAGAPGKIDFRYDRIGNMRSQLSDLAHNEPGTTNKSVVNLGTMVSGGSLGAWGRGGRGSSAAGPHALTQTTPPTGPVRNYAYDAKGSMTNIDGLTCGYDFKDRLTTAENAQMRAEYRYDHTDRRVSKRVTPKPAPGATTSAPTQTTLYINRYFELRDFDSPVKYVWQGGTRLARATGALSLGVNPIQFIRLRQGWNFVSLSTNAASRNALLADPRLTSVNYWDQSTGNWTKLSATSPDVIVAAIHATEAMVLPVRGPPVTTPATLPITPQYYPLLHREAFTIASAFPASSEFWLWNGGAQRWDVRPADATALALLRATPVKAAPGTALYLAKVAGGSTNLNLPPPSFSLRYYHDDHLGSTSVVTDSDGALVEESTSYPFGHPRNQFRPNATAEPYGFTQKELDEESGLHYFEARYLVATVGRFNRADALYLLSPSRRAGIPQSLNLFGYCGGNPVNCTDPSGKSWITKAFKLAVKGGDVAATFAGAIDDYNTLTDPSASFGSRAFAAASLLSEIAPVSVGDLKDAGKLAEQATEYVAKHSDDIGNATKNAKSYVYGVIDTKTGTLTKPGMSSGPLGKRMNQSVATADERIGEVGRHKGVIIEKNLTPENARKLEQKLTDKVEVRRPGTFPNQFHQRPTPKVGTTKQFIQKYGHAPNR